MGRSPCCDKVGLKKGPWTPEEDHKLFSFIQQHGHGSWRSLPSKAGLERCGKSCRLRWTNYLRPDIKRGKFNSQEDQTIIQLHALLGNMWSAIATHLPKRTDNEIKNYWNTHLKKRLTKMGIDPITHKPNSDSVLLPSDGRAKSTAHLSHMAQWESARLEAEARLARQSNLRSISLNQPAPGSTSTFATKDAPPPPPRCLDVLKVWGGAWNRTADSAVSLGCDLESPTSTLSFSENGPIASSSGAATGNAEGVMEEEEEEEWKRLGMDKTMSFSSGYDDIAMSVESEWTEESLGTGKEEDTNGSFIERFTDLLLKDSGDRSFSESGREADNGGDSDYCEDSKNYWNSILNLVESSPMF